MFPIGDDDSAERTVPVVTYALIALNVLVFFLELSGGEPFIERWSVVPRRLTQDPGGDFITVFTSMFMHGGWLPGRQHALPLDLRRQRGGPFRARQIRAVLPALRDSGDIRASGGQCRIEHS